MSEVTVTVHGELNGVFWCEGKIGDVKFVGRETKKIGKIEFFFYPSFNLFGAEAGMIEELRRKVKQAYLKIKQDQIEVFFDSKGEAHLRTPRFGGKEERQRARFADTATAEQLISYKNM